MSVYDHLTRVAIVTRAQHLYQHSLSEFIYTNDALPGVTQVEAALNYIIAVLYPNTKDAVATTAALPLVGNTLNDFRIVTDDGDGKAAAYRWEQREGEASASWHKIYDMDWGEASVLSRFTEVTQDLYVFKYGLDDIDVTGAAITGTYAGQRIFGGKTANTNLTLCANAGDGVGANTGYVQVDDHFRPAVDSTYNCGSNTERWLNVYADSVTGGTLTATSGVISDTSGAISFADENLTTTGWMKGATGYFSTAVEVGSFTGNALLLGAGSIKDESGAISFDNENLTTTGTITAASVYASTALEVGPLAGNALLLGAGSIKDESGAISFDNENLTTTGTFTCATGYCTTGLEVGPVGAGNALILAAGSIKDESGAISFDNENLSTSGTLGAGALTVTSADIDDLYLDGQTISTDNNNKNLILDPHGTGLVEFGAAIFPTTDSSWDIGKTGNVWNKLWIDGSIGDGTNDITLATIFSLSNINSGVSGGMSLFYNATSGKWEASAPDTEVDHGSISGLADDDHTQYLLLAGRSGGQAIVGGTAASNTLTLESTSNATKGDILFKDDLIPFTNASYTSSWAGTDLGDATHYIRDVYSKGEYKGFRAENFLYASLPASSAANVGRLVYCTDRNRLYGDNGSTLFVLSVGRYVGEVAFSGSDAYKDVNVSASIVDARNAIWQLKDNSNDYEIMDLSIKATSATNVRIAAEPYLNGTFTLIGLE